ncbi:hypothetical protein PybrP1_009901 [[Pythium] brassicae (nom. inval.)]|nr:hypothetical protein PybrP1_009901 [[Pythium] brassicae (nom. inval.)]
MQREGRARHAVARTPDGIHVSPLDERCYKHVVLRNGLQALLVSDPTAESAAAALDVLAGFNSEPAELPGLAHFCEHMLFLGTRRFPDERSFGAFLSAHGGASNAYTAARATNFYFDVAAPHLREALERFAQFFEAPLFTASATDREMRAVDSESVNYLQDDYWRINQAQRALGNPRHPHHRFGVGNLETLSVAPTAQGIDVRQALLDFHARHYSANLMRLVVYGAEDVDTLARWAHELFADIRDSGREKPSFGGELPFNREHLARRLDIVPVKDLKLIGMTWQLPPLRGERYTQQHTSVLAHLIGHEGQGSLLSYLKKHKWVNSLSVGVEEEHDEFSLFAVSVDATEAGIAHLDDVLLALFQHLQLLLASELEQWLFDELEDLAVTHFLFQSKQPPSHFTSSVASAMHSHPKEDILTHGALLYPHERAPVQELLQEMTPRNMRLLVVCKSVEPLATSEEKWYGTKYRDSALGEDLLAKLSSPGANPALMLPARNEFISSDFALLDTRQLGAVSKHPTLVRDDDACRVWWKPDVHFKKPKTHAALTFHSPLVNSSPLAYALSDLLLMCVEDELTEATYDASLAGMHYDLAVRGSTLHLGAVGYSAKLPVLIERIVAFMLGVGAAGVQEETFERVKQAATRAYENVRLEEAYCHAMHETTFLLQDAAWTVDELITAVAQCSFAMFMAHARRVFQQTFLEAFLYGNVDRESALAVAHSVVERIRQQPLALPVAASQRYWTARQTKLPAGTECILQKLDPNPENANCAIDLVYQVGAETPLERVKLALFSQIVQEPLFSQLRTTEQLGYTVFSTPGRSSGVQFFRIIVQSNVASPAFLEQRVDAFWQSFRRVLAAIDDAHFERHVQAIVKEYTERPKSQEEEAQLLLADITNHEYAFARKEQLAQLVATLRPADVLQFFDTYIRPDAPARRKLSVRIFGNATPLVQLVDAGAGGALDSRSQTGVAAAMALGGMCQGTTEAKQRFITDPREFKRQCALYELPTYVDPTCA